MTLKPMLLASSVGADITDPPICRFQIHCWYWCHIPMPGCGPTTWTGDCITRDKLY